MKKLLQIFTIACIIIYACSSKSFAQCNSLPVVNQPANQLFCNNTASSPIFFTPTPGGNVLIVGAPGLEAWGLEVKNKLSATGSFSSVDYFNARIATPSLALLQAYRSVLVFNDALFNDPNSLGDNLAAYVNSGGGVVTSVFTTAGVPIGGAFNTDMYKVIMPLNQASGTRLFNGVVYLPFHPLVCGVSYFDGGSASYHSSSSSLSPGAYRVCDWSNGRFLITAKDNVGPANAKRVDLGFYPPSSDSRPEYWNAGTDGVAMMRNALLYTSEGTFYNWTNDNPAIGLAASGSGNIPSFIPINNGTTPIDAHITVTPMTANGCLGNPITFTITIKPSPNAVATPATQSICSGSSISAIAISGNQAGTQYNWIRNNTSTVTGIPATGSGNISGSLTNISGTAVTVNFTITPELNGCPGVPVSASVNVNTAPVITCPANIQVNPAPNSCSAPVSYSVPASGSPAPALNYSFSGATSGSGSGTGSGSVFNIGVTTVNLVATNSCGSSNCSFTVTVTGNQNAGGYIIYATKEAKFGENNYFKGDVGVTASNGKAEFKKYNVLDPYKVKAAEVNVQTPCTVNNVFREPATGGPNHPFTAYNSSTAGLSNIDIEVNGYVLNGSWKDVKVKKGISATITGNNFGKITLEEGAHVTFTGGMIYMEELNVNNGKKNVNTTNVNYTNPATVVVKKKVSVGSDCRLNVNGPNVIFCLGDINNNNGDFDVHGDNTQVKANIMIPNGRLHVTGGNNSSCIMTGWYIIEKLNSDGKNVYWNGYDCTNAPGESSAKNPNAENEGRVITTKLVENKNEFTVQVYPNPSHSDFNIRVDGSSNEPVSVKIIDVTGVIREQRLMDGKTNMIKLGGNLKGGTYFAEVIRGTNRKVVKLIRLN